MNTISFEALLEKHHLKKTAARLQVLRILSERQVATSQPELETMMKQDADRVTLYRILKAFEEKGILHKVHDQNGTTNYALCDSSCEEGHHHDQHIHFNCTVCNNVYCLDDMHLPAISMPEGFKMESLNLIALGVCRTCNGK